MKKLLVVVLIAICAFSVFAAGKLKVEDARCFVIDDYWKYAYLYMKVVNAGDKPIAIDDGLFQLFDTSGNCLVSEEYPTTYNDYLKPGEYTYVRFSAELEDDMVVDNYEFKLNDTTDFYYDITYFPFKSWFELDVDDGWLTTNYMYAEVQNNTKELAYNIEVVFALSDKSGKLLYIDSQDIYECALTPGSTMVFRCEIPSSFMDYFESKGLEPANVDAIAYRLNYK